MSSVDEYFKKKYSTDPSPVSVPSKPRLNTSSSSVDEYFKKKYSNSPAQVNTPTVNRFKSTDNDKLVSTIRSQKEEERRKKNIDAIKKQNASFGAPTEKMKRTWLDDFLLSDTIKLQQKSNEQVRKQEISEIFGSKPSDFSFKDLLRAKSKNDPFGSGQRLNEKFADGEFKKGLQSGMLSLSAGYKQTQSRIANVLGFEKIAERKEEKAVVDRELKKIYDAAYREGIITDKYSTKEKLKSEPVKYVSGLIAESLPLSAGSLVVGTTAAIAGAPTAVATGAGIIAGGFTSFGLSYADAREAGLDEKKADKIATLITVTTAPLEYISDFRLLGKLKSTAIKNSFTKNLTNSFIEYSKSAGEQAVLETATEIPQTVIENAWVQTYDENRKLFDGVAEAGLAAFFSGGITDVIFSTSTNLLRNVKIKAKEDAERDPNYIISQFIDTLHENPTDEHLIETVRTLAEESDDPALVKKVEDAIALGQKNLEKDKVQQLQVETNSDVEQKYKEMYRPSGGQTTSTTTPASQAPIEVAMTDEKTGKPTHQDDKKAIVYRTSKNGTEQIDVYGYSPNSPSAGQAGAPSGYVWLETIPLEKAQKQYQTTDSNILAQRIVNPWTDYNYQTEKYSNPTESSLTISEIKAGEITPAGNKITKSADDISKMLIDQGEEPIPKERLAKFQSSEGERYNEEKFVKDFISEMIKTDTGIARIKAIERGDEQLPEGIKGQIFHNEMRDWAFKNDINFFKREVGQSPLNTERSMHASELESAKYGGDKNSSAKETENIIKIIKEENTVKAERQAKKENTTVENKLAKLKEKSDTVIRKTKEKRAPLRRARLHQFIDSLPDC